MAVLIPRNLRASLLPPHSVSPYVHKVALHFPPLLHRTSRRSTATCGAIQTVHRRTSVALRLSDRTPRPGAETPQQRLHQRGRRRTMGGRERQTELRFLGRCLGRMEIHAQFGISRHPYAAFRLEAPDLSQHGDKTRAHAGHENDVYRRSCPRQSRRSAL